MVRYVLVVASSPVPGREAEYAEWYDTVHLPDVCKAKGVLNGRRLIALDSSPATPPGAQISTFDLDVEDPALVMAEIMERTRSGEFGSSSSVDPASVKIWYYKPA
jgi:hypothetical protein